jgi:hypothetical protein
VTRNSGTWSGHDVMRIRALLALDLPCPCGRCGKEVRTTDIWVIGHIKSRAEYPELMWDLNNMRVEHRSCSTRSAQQGVRERAHRAGREGRPIPGGGRSKNGTRRTPTVPIFEERGPRESPQLSGQTRPESPHHALFDPACLASATWLRDLMAAPEDFSWPRFMSPPHPQATGSYGHDIEVWVFEQLGITLRHWQKLAIRRQYEHREDGSLCWQTILESTPRRAGKSVRLRCTALWRVDHADLFGEQQLCLHTGKDLPIAKEIHRKAWRWSEERDWIVRRKNGDEEIEKLDGSRWIVRGRNSVYGYD